MCLNKRKHLLKKTVLLTILFSAAGFVVPALHAAPPADSITPNFGYNTGSVSITDLHSEGFFNGDTVILTRNGEPDITATGVSVISSTQITCSFNLLGKATGYWDVVVTTGPFSQTLTSSFEIRQMNVESITPSAGYNTVSVSSVDLRGEGFVAGSTVALTRLGEPDITAKGVSVISSTQITCAFDLLGKATGYWDVVVTTGPFSQTLRSSFEIKEMQIESITPSAGYNTMSVSSVDLQGEGFVAGSTVALTRLGEPDIPAKGVSVIGSTQITCAFDLLGKATGYWDVVVTTGPLSQTLRSGFEIKEMQIESITPSAGYNTGSVGITDLHGTGFVAGSTVALTRPGEPDIQAMGVSVIGSTQITCAFDLLGKATGYWDVVVTTGPLSQTLRSSFEIKEMQIESITPSAGYNTVSVSSANLQGEGFVAGSTVALTRLGEPDILATGVSVIGSTQITCSFDLLGKATGYWDVVVSTGGAGSLFAALPNGFFINSLIINSIAPDSGFNTGPVDITDLEGEGFASYTTLVKLTRSGHADIAATDINVVSSNKLTCKLDLSGGATGYWDVVVSSGAVYRSLINGFNIRSMDIASIAPNAGSNTGSGTFVVSGDGFLGGSIVKLSKTGKPDIIAGSVNVLNSGRIMCVFDLTGMATGYWDVTVASGSFTYTLNIGFEIMPMTITSITPDSDYNSGSVRTDLAGSGLLNGSTIKLTRTGQGDINGTDVNITASTHAVCKFDLTGKATGYWDVVITSDSVSAALAGGFFVNSLTLASIAPNSGYNSGLADIADLHGQGFAAGATVKLAKSGEADIPATAVNIVSSSQIACSFNITGKTPGYWDVVVSTGGPASLSATLAGGFLVNSLTVASITPASGDVYGPVSVTDLRGGGFAPGASVKLARTGQPDIPATGVTVLSSIQIACSFDLTGKATGYWDVVVSTDGPGTLSATLAGGFFANYLNVASITPASGYNSGPFSVTDLHGGGFASGASVKLARTGQPDIPATGVTIVSSSQIACSFDLTGKATGYWDVVVSTGGPGSPSATLASGFLVTPLGVVSITPDFAYNSGPVSVTDLRGGGFAPGASVKLARTGQSDIPATGVTIVSPTQISCSFDLTGKETGYWDVVVSTGGPGSLSAVLTHAFEVRYPLTETVAVYTTSDSSVTLKLVSGDINIEIPAGAFSENILLTVSTAAVPASDRETIAVSALGVEINNDKGLQPVKNSAITMFYRHSDIAGLDETKLVVGRYDPVNSRWIPLPSTVYPDQNKVACITDHFSVFGLIQLAPASNLNSIMVFPNPFNPDRHTQGLTIDNLPPDAEIKIFTVAGELVKKVGYTTQNGRAKWYGVNEAGRKVASGVYIALIKAHGVNKKIKIAVEK